MNGKLPTVERDLTDGIGIKIASAAKWYLFLAEEYEMLDDEEKAKSFKQRGIDLMSMPQQGWVSDKTLEQEIVKWNKKR